MYRYFTGKQTLFSELVVTTVQAVSDPVQAEVLRLGDSGSLKAGHRDRASAAYSARAAASRYAAGVALDLSAPGALAQW